MPADDLTSDEISEVISRERLLRVAFLTPHAPYLIPLGYVWLQDAFYGVTQAGQKTRLADANPCVAFQLDTSSTTGLFEWESVNGEGRFEIVSEDEEKQHVLSALQSEFAQAPDWWLSEQMTRTRAGALQVWRLTPTRICGRRYAPTMAPDDSGSSDE